MVKKRYDKNFYFTVLDLIKSGFNLQQIAIRFGMSKQNLNYHIKPLRELNIIEERAKGIWKINTKELGKFKDIKDMKLVKKTVLPTKHIDLLPNSIRGHANQFTLLIGEIDNWNKRHEYLQKKNIKFDYYKPHKRVSFTFNNFQIRLYPKSITIWFPKNLSYIHENNALVVFEKTRYDFFMLIKRLEGLFNRSFTIKGKYWFRVSMAHYSLIKNALAKKFEEEGKKLYVKIHRGKEYFIVDNSFKWHEFEVQGPGERPIQQAQDLNNLFNYLEANPNILQKLENEQLQSKEVLKLLNDNVITLTKNQAHIIKYLNDKNKD